MLHAPALPCREPAASTKSTPVSPAKRHSEQGIGGEKSRRVTSPPDQERPRMHATL